MRTNKIIVIFLCIILVSILYNLYRNDNKNENNNANFIEQFGILDKIKKNKKNSNINKNKKENYEDTSDTSKYHKSIKALKTKSGTSFEDLLKAGEAIDTSKMSIESMKNELYLYNKSFSKEKFKNNSQNTRESFEKFGLYKEKFFELFK
jgi:hypothetical protein